MPRPMPQSRTLRIIERPDAWRWRLWWRMLHAVCWVWFKACYRWRACDARNVPARGPVIFLANHQSFLDPIVVGLALWRRPFYALARSSLFTVPVSGWLVRSLNAIPVQLGGVDMTAMRRCLEVLKAGHGLLVFPEGTRTSDGATQPFAPGTLLLIKRSGACVVPVAIEGAYEVWPRQRARPRLLGRIRVRFGTPVPAEQLVAQGPEAGLAGLRQAIEQMRAGLVRPRRRAADPTPTTPPSSL